MSQMNPQPMVEKRRWLRRWRPWLILLGVGLLLGGSWLAYAVREARIAMFRTSDL